MENNTKNSSELNNTRSMALIGPYPPPYGGVSVHIQRLMPFLEKENINYVIYNLGHKGVPYSESSIPKVINIKYPKLWIIWYFFFSKEYLIHNHYSYWIMAVISGLMSVIGKKMVITIHTKEFFNDNRLKRKLIVFALKKYSLIIAVNKNIKNLCLSEGVNKSNIVVIPAFISPLFNHNDIMEINKDVKEFIDIHSPIISANAHTIEFIKNQEVYGIDTCIDLCEIIIKNHKNIGFIFLLSKIGDNEYFEKMKQKIVDKNLQDNFKLINISCKFYPILMKSDLFIRPTITDGDAISVREALSLGVPTIASDVVQRPIGTILFKNGDINDLNSKVKIILEDLELYKKDLSKINFDDNSNTILDLYKYYLNDLEKSQVI